MSLAPEQLFQKLVSDGLLGAGSDCRLVSHERIYSGNFSTIWKGEFKCHDRLFNATIKMGKSPKGSSSHRINLADEYRILKDLQGVFNGYKEMKVPTPITFFENEDAFAMDMIEGNTLFVEVRRLKPWNRRGFRHIGQSIRNAGRWLSVFQSSKIKSEDVADRTVPETREINRLSKLAAEAGLDCYLLEKAREAEEFLIERWVKAAPVNSHGDFVPWNVMVSNNSIALLDFTHYHLSDPEEDISLMYCALGSFERFRGVKVKIESLREQLLSGYGKQPEPVRWLFWRMRSLLYLASWLRHNKGGNLWSKARTERLRRLYTKELKRLLSEFNNSR